MKASDSIKSEKDAEKLDLILFKIKILKYGVSYSGKQLLSKLNMPQPGGQGVKLLSIYPR